LRAAFLHDVTTLIDDSPVPGHDTAPTAGMRAQFLNLGQGVNCVPEQDRAVKSPLKNSKERQGIDPRGLTH
jgi:hypothetical protein